MCNMDGKTNHQGAGIYRVLLYKNGKPVKISRFKGTDNKGILSIGKASNIEKRRSLFFRVSTGSRKLGHSEGVTWKLIQQVKKYDDYQLKFEYNSTKPGHETQEESCLLYEYFKKHHELPPLNLQFPNREKYLEDT